MPPPLDRETLKNMKRSDLQRVCKEYGIKANLKTEALIDLLIDTTQARPRPTPPTQPQRAPSGRIASRSGMRLRGTSSSSVIIHDTDEEDNAPGDDTRRSLAPQSSESEAQPPPPPPRTRRAKETQYRLGMGRPTVVGGSGARSATRTVSIAVRGGSRRLRASRNIRPVEAPIIEEEEPLPVLPEMPEAGPSGTTHDPISPPTPPEYKDEYPRTPDLSPSNIPPRFRDYLSSRLQPLQNQLIVMHNELDRRCSREADLQSQISSLQVELQLLRNLRADDASLVTQLQSQFDQMKVAMNKLMADMRKQSMKSLGKARATDEDDSQTTVTGGEASHGLTSSFPQSQSLLGKRHRDPNDSDSTDPVEPEPTGVQTSDNPHKRAVRPTKKKLKLSGADPDTASGSSSDARSNSQPQGDDSAAPPVPRPAPATFTIFRGPEEPPESYVDPPPPTAHLSDFFPVPPDASGQTSGTMMNAGGAIPRPIGSDENAPAMAFNFSFNTSIFHPMSSTPFEASQPALAYPEPPASPTPNNVPSGGFIERAGGRIERNDIYHPLGRRHAQSQAQAEGLSQSRPHSAASRPASRADTSSSQTQPAAPSGANGFTALVSTSTGLPSVSEASHEEQPDISMGSESTFPSQTRRIASSNEIGVTLGMSATLPLPPETPAPPMKRTMYGTELDSDTRFGDFGVEGVATGFWAGLVPRF
ncbi:hypothetical protein GY45DRAFT_908252 [Cubamyces sp. BRFM 1775]|nr:hypothetical protein GY45DRAFT_908252 [Cubamyces sp. BRFM 1775]